MSSYFLAKSVFQHMYQRNSEAGKDEEGLSGPVFLCLQINPKSSKSGKVTHCSLLQLKEGEFISFLKNSVLALKLRSLLCKTQFLFATNLTSLASHHRL